MSAYEETRDQLHTVAEWLLAGPQFAASHTLRLRVIGTTIATVSFPDIVLDKHGLNHEGWYVPYQGTVDALGASAGLVCVRPAVHYHDDVPGGPDTELHMDVRCLDRIFRTYAAGQEALHRFAPQIRAVLWPEHFDLAIRLDDVNYGVSPGDRHQPGPYAYVGPDRTDDDPFWNAPFGAALPLEPCDADVVDQIVGFFEKGSHIAAGL